MKYRLGLFLATMLAVETAFGAVALPPLFSNNAVLRRADDSPVFGTAAPGEKVKVEIAGLAATAEAGADGRWTLRLDLSKTGPGPFDMTVEGENKITLRNVLVGEVWLCSGQSNMGWRVASSKDAKKEIAASDNPMIRCFTVKNQTADQPAEKYQGQWAAASPERTGSFTAVGYFFARELQKELNVPVGIIHSAWGGTPIEAWTDRESIDALPAQKKNAEAMEAAAANYDDTLAKYLDAYAAWQEKHQRRESDLAPAEPAEWTAMKHNAKIPGNGGVIVMRKKIKLDGKAGRINLGRFGTSFEASLNGKKIKEFTRAAATATRDCSLAIAKGDAVEGENELTLRVFAAEPGFQREGGDGRLNGEWEYAYAAEFDALEAEARKEIPKRIGGRPHKHGMPARLYNAMIHPLAPYGISGTIWYQGESNAGRASLYTEATRALVEGWRKRFENDFPFYWCQLANFTSKSSDPAQKSGWAELRGAQTKALEIPGTGQAVLIDLGEAGNIHPINKQDVGKRLAAVALAGTYGKDIPFSGPRFKSQKIEGGKIRVEFDHLEGGLVAKELAEEYPVNLAANQTAKLKRNSPDSQLEGFAVAGEDGKWFWAKAEIDGDTVLVWSEKVAAPVRFRYAWSSNPTCNLYNQAGFPAVPCQSLP